MQKPQIHFKNFLTLFCGSGTVPLAHEPGVRDPGGCKGALVNPFIVFIVSFPFWDIVIINMYEYQQQQGVCRLGTWQYYG